MRDLCWWSWWNWRQVDSAAIRGDVQGAATDVVRGLGDQGLTL